MLSWSTKESNTVFERYVFVIIGVMKSAFSPKVALTYYLNQAENIKFTLEQQMVFFARLVGHFKVADDITPIPIDNFD